MQPIVPAEEMTAAAKSGLYFFSTIIGTMKEPMAETVAAAEEQARTIVATAKVEADQTRADLAELKKAADDYRARFQRLVLDQVHVLKSDTELFADK